MGLSGSIVIYSYISETWNSFLLNLTWIFITLHLFGDFWLCNILNAHYLALCFVFALFNIDIFNGILVLT